MNMKTGTAFLRKENKHDISPCKIERIVTLPDREFQEFSENLLKNYDFISKYKNDMFVDKDNLPHCLLVMAETELDGYLVDSQGYDYPRYTGYFPNARDFINAHICEMADEIIKDGTAHTENGSWVVGFDEISQHFDSTVTPQNGIGELLYAKLMERDEVAQIIATEDCIEMTYHLEHCPQCQSGGAGGFMSLISLMGCNLEDVHLCDTDEEHDLATITELNENTLTEQGKQDWADVLSVKVNRIYTGYYGLQVDVEGCPADRLRDFSYMLAGQCSAEDFARWVNQSEPEQIMKMK